MSKPRKPKKQSEVSKAASEMAKKRALSLSPERRSEIARMGAEATNKILAAKRDLRAQAADLPQ